MRGAGAGRRDVGRWAIGVAVVVVAVGCASRHKSSLLLERQAVGPLADEQGVAKQTAWVLEPVTQTKSDGGIDVMITHATPAFLEEFFDNKTVFGRDAGMNPYFKEQMVFYIKIANQSGKKIHFNPADFVLIDDRGNQYHAIGPDYATALADSKAPVSVMTRGVIDDARPGYFGIGVPVGKILGKSQRRYSLLKMATLQAGYLHGGVTYDGLVSFWSPAVNATKIKLLLPDVKTDFGPDDLARKMLDFGFDMSATRQ